MYHFNQKLYYILIAICWLFSSYGQLIEAIFQMFLMGSGGIESICRAVCNYYPAVMLHHNQMISGEEKHPLVALPLALYDF